MAEAAATDLLQRLARDFNVRDARKLYQIAKREFPNQPAVTVNRARDALKGGRGEAGAGPEAPEAREERGRGAQRPPAGGPDRLQPEHPERQEVRPRGHRRLHQGGGHQGPAQQERGDGGPRGRGSDPRAGPGRGQLRVTTDEGNEFRTLEANLPQGAVHRQKRPEDRNATAVVDRTIQTLKKDLAGEVARRGGKWDDHVADATEAYNARPHEAVHAAPEDVETQPATQFRVLQDNAEKFQHNKQLTEGRQARLQQAGAFRAPTNANRSFQPSYGAAKELAGFDSMTVRATDGTETLLKHALAVPRKSREPVQRLTRPGVPQAVRQLRDFNLPPKGGGKGAERIFRELS